ncbi:MAG: NAD-dependent epimerase/dehydratase family protein [Candidatus Schekmanbacteria bacterium]|nr:NAD-dependent epimerase/dehydratase family protein [Candidatus Schekmanbacteria bacterium]
MHHLITGGSGFLGNLIARRLHERGEQVRILDIWEDKSRPAGIELVRCDIRNREGVAKAMRGIDIVHHNVALVPLTKSGSSFWDVNVEGSRIAAEEAVKAGVKSFVQMSSSALFGCPEHCPITNETAPKPVEIYGRAKLAGELAVREVCERAALPLVVIRPRTILGEGRFGIFQILFEWIREGRDVYVIGNGDILFQFVHAHDLMDAYMLALDAGRSGIYNVGTDRFGTLREGLAHLIEHAGTTSRVRGLPESLTINTLRVLDWLRLSPLAPWHYLTYHKAFYFDVSPLLGLGWKPRYSNDEMFRECYDWYLKNSDLARAPKDASAHRSLVKQRVLKIVKWFS